MDIARAVEDHIRSCIKWGGWVTEYLVGDAKIRLESAKKWVEKRGHTDVLILNIYVRLLSDDRRWQTSRAECALTDPDAIDATITKFKGVMKHWVRTNAGLKTSP